MPSTAPDDLADRLKYRTSGDGNALEINAPLHEAAKIILAIVAVEGGFASEPRYVHGTLDMRETPFNQSAVQFNLKGLLQRAEAP
jgi:hypothetical protein